LKYEGEKILEFYIKQITKIIIQFIQTAVKYKTFIAKLKMKSN